MRITYYGTAAGEGWPGVFCRCPLCRQARRLLSMFLSKVDKEKYPDAPQEYPFERQIY